MIDVRRGLFFPFRCQRIGFTMLGVGRGLFFPFRCQRIGFKMIHRRHSRCDYELKLKI